jgi:hypothetical protein
MRLYELTPGTYRITRGPDSDGDHKPDRIDASQVVEIKRNTGVSLTLPARKMQVVLVEKSKGGEAQE